MKKLRQGRGNQLCFSECTQEEQILLFKGSPSHTGNKMEGNHRRLPSATLKYSLYSRHEAQTALPSKSFKVQTHHTP